MTYFHYKNLNTFKIECIDINDIYKVYVRECVEENVDSNNNIFNRLTINTVYLSLDDGSFDVPIKTTSDLNACLEYLKCFEHVGFMRTAFISKEYVNSARISIEEALEYSIEPFFSDRME